MAYSVSVPRFSLASSHAEIDGESCDPFSKSQHTPGHINCPACYGAMHMQVFAITAQMKFDEAADCFLGLHESPNPGARIHIVAPRTFRDLKAYLRPLRLFFGALRLNEIHLGHLMEYRKARSTGMLDGKVLFTRRFGERVEVSAAGANKINHELQVLIRLLRLAGLWQGAIAEYYEPLRPVLPDLQPALSPEQQGRFLAIAASNPRWRTVWLYALVALHLCFSSDEMRTIRQGDINLAYGMVGVNRRYGKNAWRRRDVQIRGVGAAECTWALTELLRIAEGRCGLAPQLFLFPARVTRDGGWAWDGNKPMGETGLRKPFEEVCKAAGLEWFCWNGFRHTAITRLAERGVPIAVIKRRAGHVTNRMSEHYTHISEQAEQMYLERTMPDRKPPQRAQWQPAEAYEPFTPRAG